MNEVNQTDAPEGFIAVEEDSKGTCYGCAFDLPDNIDVCLTGRCAAARRPDGRSVIFKKIEPEPKPWTQQH
jgi:hypothetical protein